MKFDDFESRNLPPIRFGTLLYRTQSKED
jgi:hypothetical protein